VAEVNTSSAGARRSRPLPDAAGLNAVFFDFDGVILESVSIKDNAFRDLFAHLPQHLDRILEHHRRHLGRSRFEKFEWIYRELLGRSLDEDESQVLGERFSALVRSQMLSCPMVPGAGDLLRALQGRFECLVVSATPQDELERIIDERELGAFFCEVCGSPPGKNEIFTALLERRGLEPREVLAIGDGLSDYRAAEASGVHFVARDSESSRQDWSAVPVPTIRDLTELLGHLGASRDG